jgi:hypothetical protein
VDVVSAYKIFLEEKKDDKDEIRKKIEDKDERAKP